MQPDDLIVWRQDRDLKQWQLAEMVGVTAVTVCRWENGSRSIPGWLPRFLKLLSHYLKCGRRIEELEA